MGENYFGMAFRCDRQRVADALRGRAPDRLCYLSASPNGWTTAYCADFGFSNFDAMESLASVVCPACRCGALGWSLHDSDVLLLIPIDAKGTMGKAYNNAPGYFGETVKKGEYATAQKIAETIARICGTGALAESVAKTLKVEVVFAGETLYAVADAVGIVHSQEYYENLAEREAAGDDLIGPKGFIHVGEDAAVRQRAPRVCPPHLMFPACFYVGSRSVQLAWSRVVRTAWNERSWDAAVAGMEMVPVQSRPGTILLGGTRPSGNAWRMYVVAMQLWQCAIAARSHSAETAVTDRCDELLLSGLKRFWFTTGVLYGGNWSVPLSWERSRPAQRVWRDTFRGFVRWLPELLQLNPSSAGKGLRFEDEWWMFNIISAAGGGLTLDEVAHRFNGDLARALLDKKLIVPDGARFRVGKRSQKPK